MKGILIAFRLQKGVPNRVYTRFLKKFYGQETSSHGGKYRYRRPGLLDDIPYVKLIRGVIIIRVEDSAKILDFFDGFGMDYHVREVKLVARDLEILGKGKE